MKAFGANWGSVSGPTPPGNAELGKLGLNHRPSGQWTTCSTFWISGECPENWVYLQRSPFTLDQRSLRVSAQMCSHHRSVRSVQVRGGSSGRGRKYWFVLTAHRHRRWSKSSLDIFLCNFFIYGSTFASRDIGFQSVFFQFCFCGWLETSSTCPLGPEPLSRYHIQPLQRTSGDNSEVGAKLNLLRSSIRTSSVDLCSIISQWSHVQVSLHCHYEQEEWSW